MMMMMMKWKEEGDLWKQFEERDLQFCDIYGCMVWHVVVVVELPVGHELWLNDRRVKMVMASCMTQWNVSQIDPA